ncbi:MAG: hypothetical protein K2O34_00435, partial [Acetatifactor sp.]|nr:hypothetical protein [Acetatifactor sp.]
GDCETPFPVTGNGQYIQNKSDLPLPKLICKANLLLSPFWYILTVLDLFPTRIPSLVRDISQLTIFVLLIPLPDMA